MGRKNKKLLAVIIVLMLLASGSGLALDDFMIDEDHAYRTASYSGFRVGERIKYKVYWKFKGINVIDVGYGELNIKEMINVKGRDIYHMVFKVRTAKFFDIFFRIRDVYETYIDRKGCFSWGFAMDINEGKKHYTRKTRFNQKELYGLHHNSYRKDVKKADILPDMQDFVSAMYYIRTHDLEKEKEITFNLDNDGKAYEATMKFIKRERIRTKIGKIDAWKVDVSWYKIGRKKKKKESHLMWISADEDRLPLKIESVGEIGKFVTKLVKVYDRGKK